MKVLIAVDSSEYSTQVLAAASRRTWAPGTEFKIVTFVESCHDWDSEEQFRHQSEVILNERMQRLRKKLPEYKITCETAAGSPAELIPETAEQWHADLIILGSHGDSGVRKSRIGSVAAAVVNRAPCSIELVKIQRNGRKDGPSKEAHSGVVAARKGE